MFAEVDQIRGSEDYFPFRGIRADQLHFPRFVFSKHTDQIESPQIVTGATFEVYGVRGYFFAYPVLPENVAETPMGIVRQVERNVDGVTSIIETPLSFAVRPRVLSKDDYLTMIHTTARITLGGITYTLRCIDEVYKEDEDIGRLEDSSMNLQNEKGQAVIVAIPGLPEPLSVVRVNFVNEHIHKALADLRRRVPTI